MSEFYNVTAFYSDQSGRFAKSTAGIVFKERLQEPGVFVDPPVTEWFWGTPGPAPDWPAAGARLFSSRMAEIVQAHLSPLDSVQWLPAVVISPDGHRGDYSIPHFIERPDVIDREASTWGPSGLAIRWVLADHKIAGRRFFPTERFSKNVIIDDTMLAAFRAAELTGLDIDLARVSGH